MGKIQVGNVAIDPVNNPAVLNTATWNPGAAWELLKVCPDAYWEAIRAGTRDGQLGTSETGKLRLFSASLASCRGADYFFPISRT